MKTAPTDEPTWGEHIAGIRRERLKISLRRFCQKHEVDAGNWSKMERGRRPPPADKEKLNDIAKLLGVVPGTREHQEFLDLATISRGEIPHDLLSDREIAKRLPALFRSVRAARVEGEELDRIVEVIHEG